MIEERRKTHGDWYDTAQAAAKLIEALGEELDERCGRGQPALGHGRIQALHSILTKIARIVSGDPDHPDHWDDIAGYAQLGRGGVVPLTLARLVAVSLARSARWHKGGVAEWSVSDWAVAFAGEAGELYNAIKKLRRIECGTPNGDGDCRAQAVAAIAEELADTILYAPMLAARLGIDLEAAIIAKFNKVSERYGFPERLGAP